MYRSAPNTKGDPTAPAILISFYYYRSFLRHREKYRSIRSWSMDSGAFSALGFGETIDLQEYIETCQQAIKTDDQLDEVFALDVIGDWKASIQNAETMWNAGVEAIPTFHIGSPWHALEHIAEHYPKIALGGVALRSTKRRLAFLEQCFARVWPKPIHGFGISGANILSKLPFHSVDASTWAIAPGGFRRWNAWPGHKRFFTAGDTLDLKVELEWYLEFERKMRHRWKALREEHPFDGDPWPTVRLVCVGGSGREANAFNKTELT